MTSLIPVSRIARELEEADLREEPLEEEHLEEAALEAADLQSAEEEVYRAKIDLKPLFDDEYPQPARNQLCSICLGINIERLTEPTGYPLHTNLAALAECAKTCYICLSVCANIDYLRTSYGRVDEPLAEWQRPSSSYAGFQARLVFPWYSPTGTALAIVISLVNEPLEWKPGNPTPRNATWTGWFDVRVSAIPKDPANDKNVAELRPLPENTGCLLSTRRSWQWLCDCLASVDTDECIHCDDDAAADIIFEEKKERRLGQTHQAFMNYLDWKSTAPSVLASDADSVPARLIEITTSLEGGPMRKAPVPVLGLRLTESRGIKVPYTTLSYRWGSSDAVWNTTKTNLCLRLVGFSQDELPMTLREAVQVTANLGLRYMWIDSICIIQDDREDWAREAAKMTSIYQDSLVTLAADASESSEAGLFNKKSESAILEEDMIKISNTLSTGEGSTLFLFPGQRMQNKNSMDPQTIGNLFTNSALTSRGWTLQERLLSPRIIHFAYDQLYWECHHGVHESEDDYWAIGHTDTFTKIAKRIEAAETEDKKRDIAVQWWYEVIQWDYSLRQLTYSSDKLIAIAGFAQKLAKIAPLTYLGGLWKENILLGLCWGRSRPGNKTKEKGRAPSWSWASQDSGIEYFSATMQRGGVVATLIGAGCEPDEHGNDYGSIVDGWVHIKTRAQWGYVQPGKGDDNSDYEPLEPHMKSIPASRMAHDLLHLPNGQYDDFAALDSDDYDSESKGFEVLVAMMTEGREDEGAGACLILKEIEEDGCCYWERIGFAESISVSERYREEVPDRREGLLRDQKEYRLTLV